MITLNPRRTATLLFGGVAGLVLASSVGQAIFFLTGRDWVYGFVPRFSLVGEGNIPTWFASTTLLACAVLLGVIGRIERDASSTFARHWNVLALIFLYLCIDEAAELHELLIDPVRGLLGTGGLFHFAWVIPAIVLLLLLSVAYLRFLLHLPAAIGRLFVASGATYVGGAVVAEMIGGAWIESRGFRNAGSAVIWSVEESLEMIGVVLFIYALLRYLELRAGSVTFQVRSDTSQARERAPAKRT
jgi:hypothetical protein